MFIAQKRKYVHKILREKCQSLKNLEKGLSNKDVAAKYDVPTNTLSTWVKGEEKLFAALEKGNNVKRQKLRTWNHETLETTVFKWFLSLRSQNVPLSGAIIQEKASQYVKELSIENFKASDGWLRRWKERNNVTFKTISGESNSVTPEMVNAWSETSLPTLVYNYDLKDIYNADDSQTKHTNSSQKSAQVES